MISVGRYSLHPLNPRCLEYTREWPLAEELNDICRLLFYLREFPEEACWLPHMIVDNVTSEIVGHVGFQGAPKESYPGARAFLAYSLIPSARGKGIATLTSQAMIDWAFSQGVEYIDGITYRYNIPSQKVCERLGFKITNEDGNCLFWELKNPAID